MTIIDTDIISVTPPSTLDDKKSLGIDLSESLFDYDLLLSDVSDNPTATTTNSHKEDEESLFDTLFQGEHGEATITASSESTSSLSPPSSSSLQQQQQQKRPRIMQWGPQEGHESSTIVSVVLEHTEIAGPMKIVFGSMAIETAQQQHQLSSSSTSNSSSPAVWITLAASVPPLSDTRSAIETKKQIQVSVCLFDQHDPDLAIDTWDIGQFTYLDLPKEIHTSYRKRALSCEPEQGAAAKKKTTFDVKQQGENNDDVNSQLLQLLAPYNPLLSIINGGSNESTSSHQSNNLVSTTPQSTTASISWMSSPLDNTSQQRQKQLDHAQNNYDATNSATSTQQQLQQATHMLLQQGLMNQRNMYNQSYLGNSMPSKQDMYRNYLETQQRQRQQQQQNQPYLVHQQQQQQHLMSQAMNHFMNNPDHTYNRPFPSSNVPPASNNYNNNSITYNMAEQHRQLQRLQQRRQQQQRQKQQNMMVGGDQTLATPTSDAPRRASAPASSYSITNSNSCAINKAHLRLNGDLMDMMINWSMPEWQSGRRLVHFWRHTNTDPDGQLSLVECGFHPMDQQAYHQQRMRDNVAAVAAAAAAAVAVSNSNNSSSNSPSSTTTTTTTTSPPPVRPSPIVISCIYWRERNDYFITSVDCIYLLESLIGIQFTVEEKNRIRRNLEGFRPLTVSKCKAECADFFKLIMSFPHPKPRNIEKDVKVFAWKTLPHALRKIIRKYTPSYITSTPLEPIQHHQQNRYNSSASSSATAAGHVVHSQQGGYIPQYSAPPSSHPSSSNMF